jgi:hypothetical protein
MEGIRSAYKMSFGKSEGKRQHHLGALRADGRIILKRNLNRTWAGIIWLRMETGGEFF